MTFVSVVFVLYIAGNYDFGIGRMSRFRCEDGSYKFVTERGLILLDEEGGKPVLSDLPKRSL